MKKIYVSVEEPKDGREIKSYQLRTGLIDTECPYCGRAQRVLVKRDDRLWFCVNHMCRHTYEVW